jgi:hypothetical protein
MAPLAQRCSCHSYASRKAVDFSAALYTPTRVPTGPSSSSPFGFQPQRPAHSGHSSHITSLNDMLSSVAREKGSKTSNRQGIKLVPVSSLRTMISTFVPCRVITKDFLRSRSLPRHLQVWCLQRNPELLLSRRHERLRQPHPVRAYGKREDGRSRRLSADRNPHETYAGRLRTRHHPHACSWLERCQVHLHGSNQSSACRLTCTRDYG